MSAGNTPAPGRRLILASGSPYRRELLARLRLPFDIQSPRVDETALPDETPRERAVRLALAKARAVADRNPQAIVIGSDQVCSVGTRMLDKPGDAATAREELRALSGQQAVFYTAVAVVGIEAGLWKQHVDETRCQFRRLGEAEIAHYVEVEPSLDCAGGFKVEALGITLLERMDSDDPTGVIGLPLIFVANALRHAGLLPR